MKGQYDLGPFLLKRANYLTSAFNTTMYIIIVYYYLGNRYRNSLLAYGNHSAATRQISLEEAGGAALVHV